MVTSTQVIGDSFGRFIQEQGLILLEGTPVQIHESIVYNYQLCQSDYDNKQCYVYTINQIRGERDLKRFFDCLNNTKLINSEFQARIMAVQKKNFTVNFIIEKEEGDILFKDVYEDIEIVQEKTILVMKIVELLKKFEISFGDKNNSFCFMTMENLIYNKLTKRFKLIYYSFENTFIEVNINFEAEKISRTPYLPKEIFEIPYNLINKKKLNVYVVGTILLEIYTNKVPWIEGNTDINKKHLSAGTCLTNFKPTVEALNFSLGITKESTQQEINTKNTILEILKSCLEPDFNMRIDLNLLPEALKSLIPNLTLISCEVCLGEAKNVATHFCKIKNKIFCNICLPICSHPSNVNIHDIHISVNDLINCELNDKKAEAVDYLRSVKNDSFVPILGKLKHNQELTNQSLDIINEFNIDFDNEIRILNERKNRIQQKLTDEIRFLSEFIQKLIISFNSIETSRNTDLERIQNSITVIKSNENKYLDNILLAKQNLSELFTLIKDMENISQNVNENFFRIFSHYSDQIREFNNEFHENVKEYKSKLENVNKYLNELNHSLNKANV